MRTKFKFTPFLIMQFSSFPHVQFQSNGSENAQKCKWKFEEERIDYFRKFYFWMRTFSFLSFFPRDLFNDQTKQEMKFDLIPSVWFIAFCVDKMISQFLAMAQSMHGHVRIRRFR